MLASSTTRALERGPAHDSRFDRRLAQILDYATDIFAEKGYEGASMRDLSRLSGISLAGLYYYFDSKEKLLYFIQQHTFNTIMDRLRERLATTTDPKARIYIFVHNHIDYAIAKQKAMKVLSHEDDVLKNGFGTELAAIKREYYRICMQLVDDLAKSQRTDRPEPKAGGKPTVNLRTAVMGLFGMMNWLYTWYNPRIDPGADVIAREMTDVFLQGVLGANLVRDKQASQTPARIQADDNSGRGRKKTAGRKVSAALSNQKRP